MIQPVIIIGAARSGTKLLRSLIAASGQYAVVPYDVNYIWRFGNESCPHDALVSGQANDRIKRFITDRLRRCAGNNDGRTPFVEKTVSNVLRVPFVKSIFPQAKFVAIVRDGRDVVESAERCWREPPTMGYMLAKLRTFPWLRCSRYGWNYFVTAARRHVGIDRQLRTWGPRYPGIDDDRDQSTLIEVCARQWVESIEHYESARHLLEPDQLVELRYEDLVTSTGCQVSRLCEFLNVREPRHALDYARQSIQSDRLGAHRRWTAEESRQALEIIEPTLARWGYVATSASNCAA